MTLFRLDEKIAVVTGAGSGIGRAIAESFAAQGAVVWVVDRDEAAGAETASSIVRGGGKAEFLRVDVTDEAEVAAAAARIGHPIDVLVNNAGIGHVGTLLGTSAVDLDRLYAVNVRGVFHCAKAFVPAMIERRKGSVINMASIGGVVGIRD